MLCMGEPLLVPFTRWQTCESSPGEFDEHGEVRSMNLKYWVRLLRKHLIQVFRATLKCLQKTPQEPQPATSFVTAPGGYPTADLRQQARDLRQFLRGFGAHFNLDVRDHYRAAVLYERSGEPGAALFHYRIVLRKL